MAYVTFTRTWWADRACTEPKAGPKRYTGQSYGTEDAARAACARENDLLGSQPGGNGKGGVQGRGPLGLAMEYEGD